MKVCISILFSILSVSSNAALIGSDWQTTGDNLITQDTTTGLAWLDLSATANVSYDDVVISLETGGVFQGFRIATQVEVLDFWANAGVTNTERSWVISQFTEVKNLVDRLGPTLMVEAGLFPFATHTIGMADGGLALPQDQRWAMELSYANDNLSSRTSSNYYTWNVSSADPHYSTYLIQTVPLPAAAWLFISGLIGLATFKGRKIR